MTPSRSIAEVQERLARVTADCEAWRAAGMGERYLEAYSLMEALQAELAAMPAPASTPLPAEVRDDERLMAELSITWDGRSYHYGPFRYERLEDAVAYARLERERSIARVTPRANMLQPPSEEQRRAMADAQITYADGVYRFGGHSYERLDDALAYARLRRLQAPIAG